MLRIQDAFSASSVTNRLECQTLFLVTQTQAIPYMLIQVILLVQLSTQARSRLSRRQALLRPTGTSYYKKSCQGLQPRLQDLSLRVDRQPATELNTPTQLPKEAAARHVPPSPTGEVLQTTGTVALPTPRCKGSPICSKYLLFVWHTFNRPWTAIYHLSPETVLPIQGMLLWVITSGWKESSSHLQEGFLRLAIPQGYSRTESALSISTSKKTFLQYFYCFCNNCLSYCSLKKHS